MQAIDTQAQFYKYSKSRVSPVVQQNKLLQQDYLPEQLSLSLQRNGIRGVIAVESEATEVETRFLSELASTHPEILGVVGWIDLAAVDIGDRLAHFSTYTPVKGYRHHIKNETANIGAGIAALKTFNYSLDLVTEPALATQTLELVDGHPDQTFVLDACGSPDTRQAPTAAWTSMIKELAGWPNMHCKLSGLFTLAKWKSWSPAQFYPFLDTVFKAFGPDRLLFGGDWPFLLLVWSCQAFLTSTSSFTLYSTSLINFCSRQLRAASILETL